MEPETVSLPFDTDRGWPARLNSPLPPERVKTEIELRATWEARRQRIMGPIIDSIIRELVASQEWPLSVPEKIAISFDHGTNYSSARTQR
jgi:hypothetical protein